MTETHANVIISESDKRPIRFSAPRQPGLNASIKSRPGLWSFMLIVVLPSLLYSAYLVFVASPTYVSEFRVMVRSPSQTHDLSIPQMAGLSLSSQSNDNSYAVIQYLKSQPAVLALDDQIGLRAIYSNDRIDPFSRLSLHSSNAGLTHYWDGKLDTYYENTTNTLVTRVTAFDPDTAHKIASATLALSEQLVNGMSRRSRQDLVAYAQADVDAADRQLRAMDDKLFALRNQRGLIDPQQTATAALQRQSRVQAEITATQVEIATRSPYQAPNSPVIQALKKRLAALEGGLSTIDAEAVAKRPGTNETLSGSIAAFEKLQADEAFAQKQYQFALTSLQAARDENAHQQLYLDTIIPPTLPDASTYPLFSKQMAIFLIFAVAIWGIFIATMKYLYERI